LGRVNNTKKKNNQNEDDDDDDDDYYDDAPFRWKAGAFYPILCLPELMMWITMCDIYQ